MKVLLDTHILVWAILDSEEMPDSVRKLLTNKDTEVYVSTTSVWEATIKNMRHPDEFEINGNALLEESKNAGFKIISITPKDALEVYSLKYPKSGVKQHKDPFDRLLLAQAKRRKMILLTKDELIANYDEDCFIYVQ